MKLFYTEVVYNELCVKILKNQFSEIPEQIENILFLTQYELLKNRHKPVYSYKIHIGKDNIKMKYLSDLLRVRTLKEIETTARSKKYICSKQISNAKKSLENLLKLTPIEVENLVAWVIDNEELDDNYFIKKQYKNRMMRWIARFQNYYDSISFLKGMALGLLLTFFIGSCILCAILIPTLMNMESRYIEQSKIMGKTIITITILLGLPSLVWLSKIIKPTKYEKQNNYNEWDI